MDLEHSFTIPVSPEQAWRILLDVEQVAPCMPGATIDKVDGDVISGKVKVKVGPVSLTYAGSARFTEKDETTRTVVLDASGKETRGSGTAAAKVTSSLQDEGGQTRVVVHTSMTVTGRPAQFGRGVIAEVSGRIIEKFATNLASQLAGGQLAPPAAGPSGNAGTSGAAASGAGGVAAAGRNGGGAASGAPAHAAQQPIEELNLPVRSYNSLRREGVHTVGTLTARTESELLAIDGLGPQSVKEIRQRLADWGLTLGTPAGASAPTAGAAGTPDTSTATGAAGAPGTSTATGAAAGPGTGASRTSTASRDTAGLGAASPGGTADQGLAASNGLLPPRDVRPPDEDALDLLSVAGLPVLKRVLPVLGFAFLVALVFGLLRRRRRATRG
jgi:carbon monoxide dehydrogenase subunit G